MVTKKFQNFFIHYNYLNSNNGSNTHILELFHNLSRYADVTLFVPKSKARLEMRNIRYISHVNKKFFIGISYELSLFLHLFYECLRNKPNVIYLRQNSFSFFPIILCKTFKIPCIIEINGFIHDEILMNRSLKSVARNLDHFFVYIFRKIQL